MQGPANVPIVLGVDKYFGHGKLGHKVQNFKKHRVSQKITKELIFPIYEVHIVQLTRIWSIYVHIKVGLTNLFAMTN